MVDQICPVQVSDISRKPLWNPANGPDKSVGHGNLEVPDMSNLIGI
jgi:hypothetical protein